MSACIKSMAAEPTANMMQFFFVQWMSQNAAECDAKERHGNAVWYSKSVHYMTTCFRSKI